MILLNYSHPLSAAAAEQLRQAVGEFREVIIPVQIDFGSISIEQQLMALADAGNTAIADEAEALYIPPALSFAAAFVSRRLGWRPNAPVALSMVVLKAAPGPLRQFVLAEIVEV